VFADAPVQGAEAPHSSATGTLAWLRAIQGLAVVVPALSFLAVAAYLYHEEVDEAKVRVHSFARIGEEHALKVFETNVALLTRVLDMLGDASDEALIAREAALHEQLKRMGDGLPQLQGIFIIGSDGRMVATNRAYPAPHTVDFSDRVLFRYHRSGGAGAYITEVLTSRTTGEPFFDMSLGRVHADGSFGGTVSTSMAPAYFSAVYRELAGGDPDIHIALVRADGTVLASWPQRSQKSDGERLESSRPVGAYPMHVDVWIDRAAVLAPWKLHAGFLFALALAIATALFVVARVALQRTERLVAAMSALRSETTTRERVEEALRQAQKLEAMGRLTGGVAHDFNNLLAVISNNLYLLKRLDTRAADSTQLAAIERAVKAGTKLTRQLLSFSRRQPLSPEPVVLADRLPGIVDLLSPALGSPIALRTEVDPNAGAIRVDVAELELALLNLALNAKDAMPEGGTLCIAVSRQELEPSLAEPGPAVVVTVSDTGHGIPAHLRERVFEPFFTTKPAGHGTGLGLSQVYGFVRRANGSVSLESDVERGTAVRMCFPASVDARPHSSGSAHDSPVDLNGLKVLLVEDNEEVAEATRAMLVAMGCSVRTVGNGDAALAALSSHEARPDVVITDVVMPGSIDGIELARRCQTLTPGLPVLLTTGYSNSLDEAAQLGFEVLAKPCPPSTLAYAIRRATARTNA
jgi:signal transduction histidine kinase